jgi:hypothetical protein
MKKQKTKKKLKNGKRIKIFSKILLFPHLFLRVTKAASPSTATTNTPAAKLTLEN